MPQVRRDAVHRYFVYDASSNNSKCNLCGNCIKGKHTTNLKNHMSIKHPEDYFLLINIKEENVLRPGASKESINSEIIKKLCVRLVTIHGRPFAMLRDAAFEEIINIAVPSNIKTRNINWNVIKEMIPEKAYKIKTKIASEIKNTMVSVKIDSASYKCRNFLGVNLQYITNGKIVVRNLAVLEVIERQTADFLKEKLLEVLNDFMISTAQIYSITTDNGSNYKKMTRLLTEYTTRTAGTESVYDIDFETSDEEYDEVDHDDDSERASCSYFHEDLNANVNNFINIVANETFTPRVMSCAAQTLQLAVKEAINSNINAEITIQAARTAVKILRRPCLKNEIRSSNLKKPTIDCPTRWTSTYLMLVRLNLLRDIVHDSELINVFSDKFWEDIQNLIVCFKPVHEATLALQREQFTVSDFYVDWLNCQTKLEIIGTSFAQELAKAMKLRGTDLLNNDLVLENVYLDGRLNIILSDEECEKAKSLLVQTCRQLETLNTEGDISIAVSEQLDDVPTGQNEVELYKKRNTSALENYLKTTEAVRGLTNRSTINTFEETLNKLRYEPRLPLHKNILAHWTNRTPIVDTSLMKVVNVVLAAPATQVSAERLFSSIKFITNPIRSNIKGNMLRDIMLMRSNCDLFE